MGKHKNEADDFEIKILISKCNVCHSNLDSHSEHDCKRNGNLPKGGEWLLYI
jgi:hypothetical protein